MKCREPKTAERRKVARLSDRKRAERGGSVEAGRGVRRRESERKEMLR